MNYLEEAKEYLQSWEVGETAEESISRYLASIATALIAIAERMDKSTHENAVKAKKCRHGLPLGCCAICANEKALKGHT